MTKHTLGPWTHSHNKEQKPLPWWIAQVGGPSIAWDIATEANARLIAAAPDMLKALMNLVASCEKLRAFNNPDNTLSIARLEAARAAIAKAEGTSV